LWHGSFVEFGQFLDSLGKRLADAVHFAVDHGIQCGKPFVVHDQRFDFVLGELGILGIGTLVEFCFGILEPLLKSGFLVVEF
jgi:hypothetical protein